MQLDAGGLTTRPQLEAAPGTTQIWQLRRVRSRLSSGFYSIGSADSEAYLGIQDDMTLNLGSYTHAHMDWKVVAAPNGLYTLQNMRNFAFLNDRQGLGFNFTTEYWMMYFVERYMFLQNVSTGQYLAQRDGKVLVDTKGSPWLFERVDQPSPVFKDLASDKVNYSDKITVLYSLL